MKKEMTLEQFRAHLLRKEEEANPKHPETNLAGWWERQPNKAIARLILSSKKG